jgi:WD40 repeat protein
VKARPISHAARLTKWVKRRPLTAALVLLMLLAGVATLTAYLIGESRVDPQAIEEARQRERRTQQDKQIALQRMRDTTEREEETLYFRRIMLAEKALAAGVPWHAEELLDRSPGTRHWEWYFLRSGAKPTILRTSDRKPILSMATSSDGRYLAVGTDVDTAGDKKGEVRVWDLQKDQEVHLETFDGPVEAVAVRADEWPIENERPRQRAKDVVVALAVAVGKPAGPAGSQLIVMPHLLGGDVQGFTGRRTNEVPEARVTDLAYSPDRHHLAAGRSDGRTVLHDPTTGIQASIVPITLSPQRPGDPNRIRVAFTKDGRYLAVSNQSANSVLIYDQTAGRLQRTVNASGGGATCLAFSSNDRLAVGSISRAVSFIDPFTYPQTAPNLPMEGHALGAITALAFSPDAKRLATAGSDKTVKVCDTDAGMEILTLKDLPAAPVGVGFSANGHRLAVAAGNEVRIYGRDLP